MYVCQKHSFYLIWYSLRHPKQTLTFMNIFIFSRKVLNIKTKCLVFGAIYLVAFTFNLSQVYLRHEHTLNFMFLFLDLYLSVQFGYLCRWWIPLRYIFSCRICSKVFFQCESTFVDGIKLCVWSICRVSLYPKRLNFSFSNPY